MRFCIKCGSELIEGAHFCGICGYKIPEEKIVTENADNVEEVISDNVQNDVACELENFSETYQNSVEENVAPQAEKMEEVTDNGQNMQPDTASEDVEIKDNQQININHEELSGEPYQIMVQQKKKTLPIVLTVVGAVVVLCLWIVLGLFLGNDQASPKKTLEKYVDSVVDGDGEEMIEVMFPKKVFVAILKDKGMSYTEFEETFDERYEQLEDEYRRDYGRKLRGKVRITDKTMLSEDDISDKEEWLLNAYGADVNITDACLIECELTIKGNKGHRTDTDSITLYKIGGKWYILQIW